MSRLMDDLNKLNSKRKVDSGIVVQDAEEMAKAPVVNNRKTIYFIGFLIMMLVGLSAVSMTLSVKTIWRLDEMELQIASMSGQIISRLEGSEAASQTLNDAIEKQQIDIAELNSLITKQNKDALVKMDLLKNQVRKLETTMRKKDEELSDLKYTHSNFKKDTETAITELKEENRDILDKHIILKNEVRRISEVNSYLYSTY